MGYDESLIEIEETEAFCVWFAGLRDRNACARISKRIHRLRFGNPGDVAPVGDGVSELRIHYGPGYRVYYVQRGCELIILLGGGDKSTQGRDISRARALARFL
jgi:putative addiction module killer protein